MLFLHETVVAVHRVIWLLSRCSLLRCGIGGPGFLRRRSDRSLIISCKKQPFEKGGLGKMSGSRSTAEEGGTPVALVAGAGRACVMPTPPNCSKALGGGWWNRTDATPAKTWGIQFVP
jgi:hypothetical protein